MDNLVKNAIHIDNETLFKNILDSIPNGVYATDTNRRIFYWNKKAEEITGYTSSEIIGKSCYTSNLDHMDGTGAELCKISCPLFDSICNNCNNAAHVLVRHKNGERVPIIVNTYPIYDRYGNVIGGYEIFYYDDTPCRCKTDTERSKDYYDELTGLPNRKYLMNFMRYKQMEYEKFRRSYAIIFGNLDNFTEFNDKYGKLYGDRILQNIAYNLRTNSRKADLIGRWESDRILGVFNMVDVNTAYHVGEKLYDWVNNSDIMIWNKKVGVTVTISVVVVRPEDTITTMLERAYQLNIEGKKTKHTIITDF